MAPLTEATSINTSVQPISASKARSTASNCPLMRRTRPMSFDLCFIVCDMPYNIGGYPMLVNTIEHIKSVQGQTEKNPVRAYVFRFALAGSTGRRSRHVSKVPKADSCARTRSLTEEMKS
jgi:hypothetical protein